MMAEAESSSPKLPPATFLALVEMFVHQAYMALGTLEDPQTGDPIVELPVAQYAIDMLGVLEEKTKGNLSAPERNYLDNMLHQLRITFVRVQSNPPQRETEPEAEPTPVESESHE